MSYSSEEEYASMLAVGKLNLIQLSMTADQGETSTGEFDDTWERQAKKCLALKALSRQAKQPDLFPVRTPLYGQSEAFG